MNEESLIYRLRKRAEIRRNIQSRKSVQEGKPDRIADLLEEAADEIQELESVICEMNDVIDRLERRLNTNDD
jgi:DNA-binding transcriptional regulator GbsR (MarR family)